MKRLIFSLITLSIFILSSNLFAQYPPREDAIWARTVPAGTITLDGILDESVWAQAESLKIVYGVDSGLPTSGWRAEFQPDAITDPTNAVVKFLVQGNQLFLGFIIPDSSVGGTQDWARWDAVLMSVKDKSKSDRPVPPAEYFYTYWLAGLPNTTPVVGAQPRFVGTFGNFDDTTRTPEQVAAWNAVTTIDGISNDAGRDNGMVIEMKVDLGVIGYDVMRPEGDVIMLNFSIWDCDYLFEGDPLKINTTRTHWQSPWGNVNQNNVGRVYARPDITINTTSLPDILPDVVVPNADGVAEPTIDGILDEQAWDGAYTFEIAWDDTLIRAGYPGVGPYQSGQFQPELFGNPRPPILDPSYGKFKLFFRNNYLYMGADINDQLVQGDEVFDKIDGVAYMIGDRVDKNAEEVMVFNYIRVSFGMDGTAKAYDALPALIDTGAAEFAVSLKGATTVNNNTDIDEGYTVEMKVDLTHLGYPDGLGDKLLFMGAMLADGDSFDDSLNNYGSRTWWFRENGGAPAAAWMVMDPDVTVGVDDEISTLIPNSIYIYGNYPNPFNPSTKIKFSIPDAGNVNIKIYNSLGQEISALDLPNLTSGIHEADFNASLLASGVYYYRINVINNSSGIKYQSKSGKMILLK